MAAIALALSACGSLPSRPPSVQPHPLDGGGTPSPAGVGIVWDLKNLKPDEGAVLEAYSRIAVSVDMRISEALEKRQFVLELRSRHRRYHPFVMKTVGDSGTLDFSGTITWFVCAGGSDQQMAVDLYQVQVSDTGATERKTLLDEVSRKYRVDSSCRGCGFFEFVRHLFGICD